MGTLTLAQLRAELLFDLRGRTDTSDANGVSTARQNSWINSGYLHVTHPTVHRHRELQYAFSLALVNGTQSYTFSPVGGFTITSLRYVTHVEGASADDFTVQRTKLIPRDESWFQSRSRLTSAGPRDYFVRGNSIFLSPIPSANETGQVLSVGAWREPTQLAADASVTEISARWDEIVLLAARWRAELHLGYRDLAEATKIDFTSLVNEYKDFEQMHGEDWDWGVEVRMESSMEGRP